MADFRSYLGIETSDEELFPNFRQEFSSDLDFFCVLPVLLVLYAFPEKKHMRFLS